jgi:hypothetical protein
VKLRLGWKAQTRTGVKERQRRVIETVNACQTGSMRGFQFPFENIGRTIGRQHEISVYSLEFTVDLFFSRNRFDTVDSHRVTLRTEARPVLSMQALDFKVPVVDRIAEVRRGAGGFAASHQAVIQHHNEFSFPRQAVSRSYSRDSRTHDADVSIEIFVQRSSWSGRVVHPDRNAVSGFGVQDSVLWTEGETWVICGLDRFSTGSNRHSRVSFESPMIRIS